MENKFSRAFCMPFMMMVAELHLIDPYVALLLVLVMSRRLFWCFVKEVSVITVTVSHHVTLW